MPKDNSKGQNVTEQHLASHLKLTIGIGTACRKERTVFGVVGDCVW